MARLSSLALAVLVSGCVDVQTVYVDPQVTLVESQIVEAVPGDPQVRVGYVDAGEFVALEAGDALVVVWGLQTGWWTMPALRTIGIGTPALVECSVRLPGGEEVGRLNTRMKFRPVPGYLEQPLVPISIRHEGSDREDLIDDLYGVGADLTCTVTDNEDRSATVALPVVITEG